MEQKFCQSCGMPLTDDYKGTNADGSRSEDYGAYCYKDGEVYPKQLLRLSLEELWQLFPIILTPHQSTWISWYKEEEELLQKELPHIHRISHIGSTAVKDIWAKPTIDILVETYKGKKLADLKNAIERCGYICMAESCNRIDFNKGYTLEGFAERTFHLHLRYVGDNDELYFRDYLLENPSVAKEYEQLKLSLWKQYEHDRDAYTAHKGDFIKYFTEKGKSLFTGKYNVHT